MIEIGQSLYTVFSTLPLTLLSFPLDFASSDSISNIEHDGLVNMASFMWSCQQQSVIAFKVRNYNQ